MLQLTQLVYVNEKTKRKMSNNVAIPKPGRSKQKAKLDLMPSILRGKVDLQETALIILNVRSELATTEKLLTQNSLPTNGCERIAMRYGEREDQSAGKLLYRSYQSKLWKVLNKDLQVRDKIMNEMRKTTKTVSQRSRWNKILTKRLTTRPQ